MSLLGLHQPGTTWLHRLPASAKLLGLFVAGVVVVVLRGPLTALVALAAAVAVLAWSGAGLRVLLRTLRGLLLVVVLVGAYSAWAQGWERAVELVADLLALVLLATVLTVTTPIDEVLDTVTRGLGPLRRCGVDPERVGLAFALMIRAVPTTLDLARQTREAAVARGLQRDPRARLVPLVVRSVAHARATGDALDARGIGD
ncbi:energy-coupling factor transporter transmembrane component T [Nocardioides euryhalodurans]|uniref:Energy-coupling factor transporter transmembrane protein EcfT n=1 Tax=Nocardioides euryhalodurans TaxID=2518370 RepID=A0A4P7GP57_9ACTN|nr:energy-coupling factor transporter transmembrane component T [Nocardioides euryhalodurans]QBR94016.1 energy-coupling factor transporter transmembrane protein EcfT [Nocardioides euryhalodurans]